MTDQITELSASALALAIRKREVSANEALDAHFAQIDRVNPHINAIVTLDRDVARHLAVAADILTASGADLPSLHGVPMTHKDTHSTAGMRTTFGSPLFADHVPRHDDLIIERFKAAGVVTTGKSNVPEFAAGSHTFNEVFGTTTNPYDPRLSAGGSSGGAAAALAARIQSISDGSDMGGSLRIPASFCNVVGFRPSLGVIPLQPSRDAWSWLARSGPMAREVTDIALVMSVLAGPDVAAPYPCPVPASRFREPLQRDLTGLVIGWSDDFGLDIPVQKDVLRVLHQQLRVFEDLGATVEQAAPDLQDADEVFSTVRAFDFALAYSELVAQHGDRIKPEVRWNVEQGLALTGADVVSLALARTRLAEKTRTFFSRYDVFASPATQLLPFDAALRYPTEIDGMAFETYLEWMRSACVVSATGLPALCVPAGFSESGLPVGMQLVMNHGQDFELLQVGYGLEQASRHAWRAPELHRLDTRPDIRSDIPAGQLK
ncbi:MAG: amidase [Cryobacterium sp.]|uniref:amidase n=1 Tax=unclassified Cryobacterium TaxID=2649013 RepID=UPI0018C9CFB9|nr:MULTISPECIES: amidase [unclassified Cryobacterium]MCY7403092.1 amidase [Cryobacterium sp.]MEC5152778.1 amidase [Cryobacterium sp. CAN_C3]